MAAFLEDITPFLGTGIKNEAGQTLEEFLDAYDPLKYKNPCSTADAIVIRSHGEITNVENGLRLLMVQRRNHPSIGLYALPGGFVEVNEDIGEGARRELMEETGLIDIPVQQMFTWGEVWRDPRTRIITTSFLALVDDSVNEVKAGDDAKDARWMDINFVQLEHANCRENNRERVKDVYQLTLKNEEIGISMDSKVEVTYNRTGILKEAQYEVIENHGIAFDHPRMIAQALLYIKENL